MKIKWRYFIPKIINIGLVIWTYHRGPEFFEAQCSCWAERITSAGRYCDPSCLLVVGAFVCSFATFAAMSRKVQARLSWALVSTGAATGAVVFSCVRLCVWLSVLIVSLHFSVNAITPEMSSDFQCIILWSKRRTSSKMKWLYRVARVVIQRLCCSGLILIQPVQLAKLLGIIDFTFPFC